MLIASVVCMFEAQEDHSDSSQQTTASDEDKGTVNEVLTIVTADKFVGWPSGSKLGNFHQLQLISDYRHDYSEWVMHCVFISLF